MVQITFFYDLWEALVCYSGKIMSSKGEVTIYPTTYTWILSSILPQDLDAASVKPSPALSIRGRNAIILVHVVLCSHLCSGSTVLTAVDMEWFDSTFSPSSRLKICRSPCVPSEPSYSGLYKCLENWPHFSCLFKDFQKYFQLTKNLFYRILEAQIRNDIMFIFLVLCSKKNTRLPVSRVLKELCIFSLISRMWILTKQLVCIRMYFIWNLKSSLLETFFLFLWETLHVNVLIMEKTWCVQNYSCVRRHHDIILLSILCHDCWFVFSSLYSEGRNVLCITNHFVPYV